MDDCIFCKIIKGEIPSYKVWEDENFFAFLTIAPHKPGHTLLIPKKHQDYIFDLADSELSDLVLGSKPLAKVLKQTFNPKTGKVGLVVAGVEVQHVHLHLIPMDSQFDLNTSNAQHDVDPKEFEEALLKIKANLPI